MKKCPGLVVTYLYKSFSLTVLSFWVFCPACALKLAEKSLVVAFRGGIQLKRWVIKTCRERGSVGILLLKGGVLVI